MDDNFNKLPTSPAKYLIAGINDPNIRKDVERYGYIGNIIKFDPAKPPRPDTPTAQIGNTFADGDEPTIAGRMFGTVYKQITDRPEYQMDLNLDEKPGFDKAFKDFRVTVVERLQTRPNNQIKVDYWRESGTDQFHTKDGPPGPHDEFMMYFNKSQQKWKNPKDRLARAYITLSPRDGDQLPQNFVDLCLYLYDAGIDFQAKAVGPKGLRKRMDNIVVYISAVDQPKASELLKKFMSEKMIGKGHLPYGIPSPQEGLTWAPDCNAKQTKIWQQITGSSESASFNSYVAALAMPCYLDRVAMAHLQRGDTESAAICKQEAERIKQILKKR